VNSFFWSFSTRDSVPAGAHYASSGARTCENPRLLTPAGVMNRDGDIDIDIPERANIEWYGHDKTEKYSFSNYYYVREKYSGNNHTILGQKY